MSSPNLTPAVKAREDWLDTVRAAACLMVVLLHVAAYYVLNADIGSSDWDWANAIDSATRSCVPLFFMITGYLFFRGRAPRARHLLRVVTSIAAYSLIAVAFIWVTRGYLPLKSILAMPYQPVFYHLWYLYAVLAIYLVASVVSLRMPASWAMMAALLVLMFGLNGAGLAPQGSRLALSGSSIVYLLLAISGAVLGDLLPTLRDERRTFYACSAFIVFFFCVIATALMTRHASMAAGSFVGTFYNYSHPLVIGAAISGFTCLHLASPPQLLRKIIRSISDNSLAIYGVHAFILVLAQRAANATDAPAAVEMSFVFIFVATSSYLVARLLRQIDRRGYFT